MAKLLIKNATLVRDKLEKSDLLIENGVISKIQAGIVCSDAEVVDAQNKYVFAGFIDTHVHLREPGQTYKEDINSGTAAAVKGGITSVMCMPNTVPPVDNQAIVGYIVSQARQANNCKVYPIGCITKNQDGTQLTEFGLMKSSGIVGVSDDGKPVSDGNVMRLALEYAKDFGLVVISHCEDKSIAAGGYVNEGYNSTICGLKGVSRAAEETMVARDIILAESLDAAVHIAHISTEGSVRLVRQAKSRGVKVTAETCPHYFTLTDDEILSYDTNTKVNPPLRLQSDKDAIIQGLKDGTIDLIVTDHAPHHIDDKNVEYSDAAFGISGLETSFCVSYQLVKDGHISLEKLSQLMSGNAAKLFGLSQGRLQEDAPADIVIVDLQKQVTVNATEFVSKGKNTPLNNRKFYGKIEMTIVDGDIKYRG